MKLYSAFVIGLLLLPLSAQAARVSPVDGGAITSVKGWRLDPFGSGRQVYHSGYDIAVPAGTPVHPTQVGTVFFAGPYHGYGNLVAIDHGNGYLTYYGHNSQLLVKPGDKVDTDSVIALSGSTGRSTGPHVHYEMRHIPSLANRPPVQLANTAANLAAQSTAAPPSMAAGGMGGGEEPALLPDIGQE